MAFSFRKYNGGTKVLREGFDTDGWDFVPIKEYEGKEIPVNGFFFTEGDYGKQLVIVGDGELVNMPKRAVETFEAIKDDPEAIEAIMGGHLKLTDIKLFKTEKGKKDTYTYTLTDC